MYTSNDADSTKDVPFTFTTLFMKWRIQVSFTRKLYNASRTIFYDVVYIIVICGIQLFKKEEQNFVFANEIDNMALIMPSQDKHATVASPEGKAEAKPKGKRRSPKKMEMSASLNVACLKRLLPIGLNMFGGREQELIQQSKQMLIDVSSHFQYVVNSFFLVAQSINQSINQTVNPLCYNEIRKPKAPST